MRFSTEGGFMPLEYVSTQLPTFTLYGDGTVYYRPVSAQMPERKAGDPIRFAPLLVAKMTEPQVQALLAEALGAGGLAIARTQYLDMTVSDAPTTVITVNAGGTVKQVSVYALGIDPRDGPDAGILKQMAALSEKVDNFDTIVAAGGATAVGTYQPNRFRALLVESEAAGLTGFPTIKWPWLGFGPTGFIVSPDGIPTTLPYRDISGMEAGQVGFQGIEGGLSGVTVTAGTKAYRLSLRPLLPDESR